MWVGNNNQKSCENLKLVFNIMLFFSAVSMVAQENFFNTHDYNLFSQIYSNVKEYNNEVYCLGGTVCITGECGILSKYDADGELVFLNQIDNIDVNSRRCLGLKNDTLILIALSKYAVGARLQMYDLDGNQILDSLVIRDEELVYTWPVDALYKEHYFYCVVNERYNNEARQTAVYKVDYEGNVLDYIRLPYNYRGEILTLTQLNNGNLFVTQPYIDEEDVCAFNHVDIDNPNAVIFYEISADSLEIVREKQDICYQYTNPVSYNCTILANNTIVRNILWRDPNDENIIHASNIYYNSDWEEIDIYKYPQVIVGNSLIALGVLGNRSYKSRNEDEFYVIASISYPQPDEDFPYIDFLIQKWDIDRNLIWERVISDPNIHHRIYFNSLVETESQIILAGYVWSDFDIAGTQDFAVMSLDLDGCYNGDCSDTIYLNGPPTSVYEEGEGHSIIVYPNPLLDIMNVQSTSLLESITVYSMEGRLIREEVITGYEYTMDVGDLASGMYLIQVVSDSGTSIQKIMKQ